MAAAVQTDDAVREELSELEEAYIQKKEITTETSVSANMADKIVSDKVSMMGGALNVTSGKVTLSISAPAKK